MDLQFAQRFRFGASEPVFWHTAQESIVCGWVVENVVGKWLNLGRRDFAGFTARGLDANVMGDVGLIYRTTGTHVTPLILSGKLKSTLHHVHREHICIFYNFINHYEKSSHPKD